MFGLSNWLRSKFTALAPASNNSNSSTESSWMDDPAYACALTLPYGQMREDEVDRIFVQLKEWANEQNGAPTQRNALTVNITAAEFVACQLPGGLRFSGFNRDLAEWITSNFPAIRELSLKVWSCGTQEQVADAVGGVLFNSGWCHRLTQVRLDFNQAEVAWTALVGLEACTALKRLYFSCAAELCSVNSDGSAIKVEGPRPILILPYLVRLTHLDLFLCRDDFSAIWYSLYTFVATPAQLEHQNQKLFLVVCIRERELDEVISDLRYTAILTGRIRKLWLELPAWDPLNSLRRLVGRIPGLRALILETSKLSLRWIMCALCPLAHLQELELYLEDHTQLSGYDAMVDLTRQLKRITRLYLTFDRLEHSTIQAATLKQLFPSARILLTYFECSSCNLKNKDAELCWNKIVVGNGICRAGQSFNK